MKQQFETERLEEAEPGWNHPHAVSISAREKEKKKKTGVITQHPAAVTHDISFSQLRNLTTYLPKSLMQKKKKKIQFGLNNSEIEIQWIIMWSDLCGENIHFPSQQSNVTNYN